jgi:ATP-dependent Clp protease adaptor protein ClpS
MKNELYKQNTGDLATKSSSDEPGLYQILIHHDDFTPMEFVIRILEKFFYKDRREAADIMLTVRQEGKATCGSFTKDVAESKIAVVTDFAHENEFPLVCSMEAA